MIKEGPSISLFLKLTGGSDRRGEQTAIQHRVGGLAKKSTFAEGEEFIVCDLKSKLSSKGKITEVLGNNTYLADCGNGPQHISGDVIYRINDIAQQPVGQNIEVHGQPRQTVEDDVLMDQEDGMGQEDGMSIMSESSMDSEGVHDVIIPEVPVPR